MKNFYLLLAFVFVSTGLLAQKPDKSPFSDDNFSGFKMRNIGPAFSSGRIADIAVHPDDDNHWYVAVGSGGVWETKNAGNNWDPIFDNQSTYSTGCITLDPSNPHTVWLGTGENVGGRHVAYGDGIYRSTDGGKSWKNMGLKNSEHISKIIVHPENSDVILVAVQGPLWSKGGERGLYKSTDAGESWNKVLGDDEWVGVTDIVLDPRNPNWMYAATWQRHRTVAAYMGGGPGSGIHRSTDGGETWEKLSSGLPGSDLGKIGLAISPQQPDIVYAAIELDRTKGGVFRSTNRGASWEKRSNTVSGGTGPHYYQELYACPHNFDRIYLMDVRVQVSDDGGSSFRRLSERGKHSDNHAMAFRMDDPDYLLIGSDGGLYESFDLAQNWRFMDNMPITQYYKVAVDDALPFYNVYGGTQDNGSHGGPSQTDNSHGIRNADWYKTLGADGHQSATEPGNPNIMYAETQQGGLHRIDLITGEQVFIQPQAGVGEDYERYNWDAPIIVSPHEPSRIYFASQRVWRSDNRGNSWTAISGDLTRDEDRMRLPIMGQTWGWDAAWDVNAMSNYNSISSISESPIQEGLIYAGTDDGIIQVTEDGGQNWRKMEVGSMPGVPATAFVNHLKADLHDANTVYVALDNHKYGDFQPYLLKSTDRGKSWTSISSNIPDRTLVWRVEQDHIKPGLLFAATEFGIYFSLNSGDKWIKITSGVPTISFRDITIQRREDDLVAASFGRSFFILDDYSPLREVSTEQMEQEATLFAVKDARWYRPRSIISSQGTAQYTADNPDFGAVFTYHLSEGLSTLASDRKKEERKQVKDDQEITIPDWDVLEAERRQEKPQVWLTVKDNQGNVVRRISAPSRKGFHRVAWDLRHHSRNIIRMGQGGNGRGDRGGFMAAPGTYTVMLSKEVDGVIEPLSKAIAFNVVPLREPALKGASKEELIAYRQELEALQADVSASTVVLDQSMDRVAAMQQAYLRTETDRKDLGMKLHELKQNLFKLDEAMYGNRSKDEVGEKTNPTVRDRMFTAYRGMSNTYGPTPLHRESLAIAQKELGGILSRLSKISEEVIPTLEKALSDAGAPWIQGQALPKGR